MNMYYLEQKRTVYLVGIYLLVNILTLRRQLEIELMRSTGTH